MRSFTDTTGRTWHIQITVGAVMRVREQTDVLLTSLFDDECKLMGQLCTDFIKLVDVLWVLCQKPAESAGVDAEAFAESLGGDALGDAMEALWRATADFFTSPEQRSAIHAMLDTLNATAKKFATETEKMANELDSDQLAKSCLAFVTNGQASQESTPTDERLAS